MMRLVLTAAVAATLVAASTGCSGLSQLDLPRLTGDKIDNAVIDGKLTPDQADKIKDVVNQIDDKIKESEQ